MVDVRGGACDEEEGRGGAGSDGIHDEDSPSPPRVARRFFNKRGGAARKNGALCLALCVSAASLVWIIARDETGPNKLAGERLSFFVPTPVVVTAAQACFLSTAATRFCRSHCLLYMISQASTYTYSNE